MARLEREWKQENENMFHKKRESVKQKSGWNLTNPVRPVIAAIIIQSRCLRGIEKHLLSFSNLDFNPKINTFQYDWNGVQEVEMFFENKVSIFYGVSMKTKKEVWCGYEGLAKI